MEKETLDYVEERARVLAASEASTQVTKDAAQAWLDAVTADSTAADEATKALLDTLEGRPTTIDESIEFAKGPAVQMFGKEVADKMLAEEQQRKVDGAKFCGCEACTAASELLGKFCRVEL